MHKITLVSHGALLIATKLDRGQISQQQLAFSAARIKQPITLMKFDLDQVRSRLEVALFHVFIVSCELPSESSHRCTFRMRIKAGKQAQQAAHNRSVHYANPRLEGVEGKGFNHRYT